MQAFTRHQGIAAPLRQNNIDTDAIIPSREMKRVSKKGLGTGLFAVWRYSDPATRTQNPDFILNQDAHKNTSILLSGTNFGCGSSREHAVWALDEYGIRSIIAVGFGSIFYQNCIRNGILPVELPESEIDVLADQIESDPQHQKITVDLENQQVIAPQGDTFHFSIAAEHRTMLLKGLDSIGLTLQSEPAISAFEHSDQSRRPWLYSR